MKAVTIAFVCLVVMVASQEATDKPEPTNKPKPTSKPESTTTEPPTTEPPVDCDMSIGEEDWAVLLPNPGSCFSYYVCDAGVPIFMECPDGLHFNSELSVCDWPSAANCTTGESDEALLNY